MDVQLSNYVRGKVLEILIVTFAAAILFSFFGLKYTALLSVLVGLSVLIPYVGFYGNNSNNHWLIIFGIWLTILFISWVVFYCNFLMEISWYRLSF